MHRLCWLILILISLSLGKIILLINFIQLIIGYNETCQFNQSIDLSKGFVNITDLYIDLSSSLTIAFWFYLPFYADTSQEYTIISIGNSQCNFPGEEFSIQVSDQDYIVNNSCNHGTWSFKPKMPRNHWNFIVLTRSQNKVYLDLNEWNAMENLVNMGSVGGGLSYKNVNFGRRILTGKQANVGYLNEIRIWARTSLSPSDIKNKIVTSGLVASWNGTIVQSKLKDSAGNHDGELSDPNVIVNACNIEGNSHFNLHCLCLYKIALTK